MATTTPFLPPNTPTHALRYTNITEPALPTTKFHTSGVAGTKECSRLHSLGMRSGRVNGAVRYNVDFGREYFFTPRESFKQLNVWDVEGRDLKLMQKLAARAGRRLERHHGVLVNYNNPLQMEIQCMRPSTMDARECHARFQTGCAAHFFAYQWCSLVLVNRDKFWDCYLDSKSYLTGVDVRHEPPSSYCKNPLLCHGCTILWPPTLLFALYAYFAKRFREFACCLVFFAVLVCLGPFRLAPCDVNPCDATTPDDFMGQNFHAENCHYEHFRRRTSPPFEPRHKYTAVIVLSDPAQGGSLIFPEVDAAVAPRCGAMVGVPTGREGVYGRKGLLQGEMCLLVARFEAMLPPGPDSTPGGTQGRGFPTPLTHARGTELKENYL